MPAPDNCRCCIGSNCEPTDPGTCGELHGECKASGGCAATSALYTYTRRMTNAVHLLLAGGTFNALDDLRDRLLAHTVAGKQLLLYNKTFDADITALVRANPRLLRDGIHAFLLAASFSRALMREMSAPGSERRRQWTTECATRVEKVVIRFSKLTRNKSLQRALDHVRAVNRRCTGMTAPAVLALLNSGESFLQTSASSKGA